MSYWTPREGYYLTPMTISRPVSKSPKRSSRSTSPGAATAVQQSAGWSEFLCYLKARVQFDVELRAGREL